MAYTYAWLTSDKTILQRTDQDGHIWQIPADDGNRHYQEFLSTGATAANYVEPSKPVQKLPKK